jgi:hypothetical protein
MNDETDGSPPPPRRRVSDMKGLLLDRLKRTDKTLWDGARPESVDLGYAVTENATVVGRGEVVPAFTTVNSAIHVADSTEECNKPSIQRSTSLYQTIPTIHLPDNLGLTDTFQHTKLDDGAKAIRVVQVLPDRASSGLVQCLIHHTVVDDQPYQCLSYEWGTEDGGGQIFLNGRLITVRANLLAFLEESTHLFHSANLWIDALCIDQGNDKEKSCQVRRMGSIYENASQVIVWLGRDARTASILSSMSTTPKSEWSEFPTCTMKEIEDAKYLKKQ